MGAWDNYEKRIDVRGSTSRERTKRLADWHIGNKMPASLSYFKANIDGRMQEVAVINSDNLNEKYMLSMPGEDILLGGIVTWSGAKWMVTEKDFNNELYTKAKLLQCNYLLKWVDEYDVIHQQWCAIEDGTKYLTGDYEDRDFVITRGDSRIAMTISRNNDTAKFGRKCRFIIDDTGSSEPLAYVLTKPLKVGQTYLVDGVWRGVYKFVLSECNTEDDDNLDFGIADYYSHFDREPTDPLPVPENIYSSGANAKISTDSNGRRIWI